MANKVVRGGTAILVPYTDEQGVEDNQYSPSSTPYWTVSGADYEVEKIGDQSYAVEHNGVGVENPDTGWNLERIDGSRNATISVPLNEHDYRGSATARLIDNFAGDYTNVTVDISSYQFEVVCMTVAIVSDPETTTAGVRNLTASHSGGQGTYTDTWSKVGAGTLTVSGNNATLTLADGETATATVNSQDGGGIADYVPCTATASRNFAGGATSAGFPRWRCTSGVCESYIADTQTEGFATQEECIASGCGGTGSESGRYVCVNGECVYQSTTQAPYGFATLAECQAGCGGTPPPGGENTGADGCCLPGFYREVAGGPCVPVAGGGGVTGGRWLCVEGRCLLDPDAVAPTGYETRDECETRCGPAPLIVSPADCARAMGIYADDIRWNDAEPGMEIYGAALGFEVRPLCDNPACLYWVQIGVRTGTALDGDYSDAAWLSHQLVTLRRGAGWPASGTRIARHQRRGTVILDAPGPVLRMRQMWTPVYEMWTLATGSGSVAKIRETEPGKALVFGTGPAKAFTYAGAANDLPRAGVLTALPSLEAAGAGDAIDAALLGDKLFVIRPGELFFIDLDSGEASMNYAPRGETRAPLFVETLGDKVLGVFVDAALPSERTRCYDLTYAAPKLLWSLDDAVTLTNVSSDGQLLIAAGTEYFTSTGGTAAPVLAKDFASTISALAGGLAGLINGEIWKRTGTVWTLKTQIGAPVGALANWFGDQDALHGLAGAASGANPQRLSGELAHGGWAQDRSLVVPPDLLPATVSGVTALGRTSIQLEAGSETQSPRLDERMLIGTGSSGLLFVYRLSNLSEKDGAFKACYNALPRLTPLYRPILTP